ncbi:MAG TPA: biopolymer transporter ExbD [Pirellulaceae bacterium]|nr:biopolymer transporter ExbD [Pirellulaceae bacterium]
MAAMLDMAFQLLTFFILTFKPPPVEGQVMLRLPPPQPVTNIQSGQKAGDSVANNNPVQGLNTLLITALGKADGSLGQMGIGETSLGGVAGLDRKLSEILADPGAGFDQVIVQVGSTLSYEGLMQVVDVCARQKLPSGEKLTKLSFVELPDGG